MLNAFDVNFASSPQFSMEYLMRSPKFAVGRPQISILIASVKSYAFSFSFETSGSIVKSGPKLASPGGNLANFIQNFQFSKQIAEPKWGPELRASNSQEVETGKFIAKKLSEFGKK